MEENSTSIRRVKDTGYLKGCAGSTKKGSSNQGPKVSVRSGAAASYAMNLSVIEQSRSVIPSDPAFLCAQTFSSTRREEKGDFAGPAEEKAKEA